MEWELIWRDIQDGGYSHGKGYRTKHASVWRHKAPGGWLVRSDTELSERSIFNNAYFNPLDNKSNITFVPDPNYEWDPLRPEREKELRNWFLLLDKASCIAKDRFHSSGIFNIDESAYGLKEEELRCFILKKKDDLKNYKLECYGREEEMRTLIDAIVDRCPL